MKEFAGIVRRIIMFIKPNSIHLEPTSNCNARCPQCARTYDTTMQTDPTLRITEWSSEDIKKLLEDEWLSEIQAILVNGNFGDIVMHTHPKEFIEALGDRQVEINTNGGGLNTTFWQWLGGLPNIHVEFGIDGINNFSHSMYRRNTRYETVIQNARAYIDAGGSATWAMTIFKHNENEITQASKFAKEYGFKKFITRISDRFNHKNLIILDGDYNLEPASKINNFTTIDLLDDHDLTRNLKNISQWDAPVDIEQREVSCYASSGRWFHHIYISADKRLWSCCHMAHSVEMARRFNKHNSFTQTFYKDKGYSEDFNSLEKYTPLEIYQTGMFHTISEWKFNICKEVCGKSA